MHKTCIGAPQGTPEVPQDYYLDRYLDRGEWISDRSDHGLLYTRIIIFSIENRVGRFGIICNQNTMLSAFIRMLRMRMTTLYFERNYKRKNVSFELSQ